MTDEAKTMLVGGAPVPEDRSHTKLKPNGQQQDYIVLAPEERAKGYVRPVRRTYVHVGDAPEYPLRDLTPEERAKWADEGYTKYEEYPESRRPALGRYYTEAQLHPRCGGTVTTMSPAIAETYARDPHFYGGTFCVGCGKHFPVGPKGEFVWEGTDIRVGT